MYPVTGLLAAVLAALPIAVAPGIPPSAGDRSARGKAVAPAARLAVGAVHDVAAPAPDFRGFSDAAAQVRGERAAQVRIEQRVIIRIAPAPTGRPPIPDPRRGMPDWRQGMITDFPGRGRATHLEERRMAQCVPVGGIAGVRVQGGNRLMLFMRDQRIVSAALEKTCNPRDFYSGFYLERTADGMLCSGRDTLHSRSGANCALGRLRQLVEVEADD